MLNSIFLPGMDQYPHWLHWLEQCPSTNSWAAEATLAATAKPIDLRHGDVVFTRQQTAGRGQHGRTWQSPPGVLTASFILESIPVEQLAGMGLFVGLAVIEAVEELVPDLRGELRSKWTNDVFLRGRKLAGILCESGMKSSERSARVIVGVGLNRCVDFEAEELTRRISLHEMTTAPDELPLLERLRHHLLQTAELMCAASQMPQGIKARLDDLRQRDFLLGKRMTIETTAESITGEAIGIGDRGELLLRLLDGTERAFISGHVVLL
jgi:BirA family transcriptional regulator, biotin operon repressor / biotin---[acetyl-CoA-carboxylase] ligase